MFYEIFFTLCRYLKLSEKNFGYVILLKSDRYRSNIFVTFFDLYFIGSVCLDDHLTDLSMAGIVCFNRIW